jgi:amino acid efflux transporter
MALAFFSFTGWELFAALAEEMKNPRRDFPLAVILSFVVVATLYVGAALAVQSAAVPDDPLMARAPFLPVITRAIGGAVAEPALAALVFLVIASSLVGNVWAASRLVFDMGRSGYLPAALGADRFDGRSTPQRALYTVSALFLFTIAVHFFFGISLDLLLKLAGQNFFMLYVACVFVFVKVVSDWWEKAFALLALIGLLAFTRVFGWGLIYPAVLFAVPYIVWRGTVPPVR